MKKTSLPNKNSEDKVEYEMAYDSIYIEGVPGIGKTTLAHFISEETNSHSLILENYDNPYISDIHNGKNKCIIFESQVYFLLDKLKITKDAKSDESKYVYDFEIELKTKVFADYFLNKRQNAMIDRLIFECGMNKVYANSIYIYLHANSETILNRIRNRKRTHEINFDKNFIESLESRYKHFISKSNKEWHWVEIENFEKAYSKIMKIVNHV